MPIKLSSLRDLRSSRKRAAKNLRIRENLRYLIRQCRQEFVKKDAAAAKKAVQAVVSALDRAVRSRVVKAGYAARHKSRFMRHFNQLGK